MRVRLKRYMIWKKANSSAGNQQRKSDKKLSSHLQYNTTAKWHWNLSVRTPEKMATLQSCPGSTWLGNTNTHRTALLSGGWERARVRTTGVILEKSEGKACSQFRIISSSWVMGSSGGLWGSLLRGSNAREILPAKCQKPLRWPVENCNWQSQTTTAKTLH